MRGSLPRDLAGTVAAVRPLDEAAVQAARRRQGRLTKPAGSLGVLEDVSVQLAGLAGRCPAPLPHPATVAVFAADHGVHAQGVSPWPQEVTAQMVANFLAGGAAVSVIADHVGASVVVVDVGVAGPVPTGAQLLSLRVRDGTADLSTGEAMTRDEAHRALLAGVRVATGLVDQQVGCLLTGDMGIANTTASSALIAAFGAADPAAVTGRGTGIDEGTWNLKVDVVRAGLQRHRVAVAAAAEDPVGVLCALGGLEHAGIAGFVLGAAARRVPVILDGVIAGAAALVAQALAPDVTAACIAGHRSAEPGHAVALARLGLRPLIELDLRLGEGTGAVLALPLVQAAARVLRDMATFADAGVSEQGGPDGRATG
jgi:nicotinate-nucleotide--dimethylbenzimidazole phosphoribosyltransferase